MLDVRAAKTKREVDLAYELVSKVFGPNYFEAREVKRHLRELENLRALEDAIVALKGNAIVGFLRILNRQYYSPVGLLNAGGITSVCVHPEFRGQGLGGKLMESALQRSRQRGDDFSILFARRVLDGWYPKFGYVGIGCHLEMQVEKSHIASKHLSFGGSFRKGIDVSYIDTYADAYADTYQDLFLGVYRDEDWWQALEKRLWRKVELEDLISVLMDGKPIGYFMIKEGSVIEAASLGKHRADFIDALIQFYVAKHDDRFVLAVPSKHWCIEYFKCMNHSLTIRYSWDGGHMIRIIDESVFKEIVKQNTARDFHSEVEKLFEQYKVSEHESAKWLLATIVGAFASVSGKYVGGNQDGFWGGLLPMLPTWSIIDEL